MTQERFNSFVFSADWHESRLTWQGRASLVGDSFYSLLQIIDYCIANRAPLLAGGDLLDRDRPDSAAVSFLYQQMDRMQQARLPVYYIEGQHELVSPPSPPWMSAHPWPTHVNKLAFEINGRKFWGCNWHPVATAKQTFAQIPPGTEFVMAHQVWAEHMGNVVAVPEVSVHDVPHANIILTGDYHVTQITQYATQYGQKQLVSPGSISMRSVGESPAKGFYVYDLHTNQFNFQRINTRLFYDVTLIGAASLNQLVQEICRDVDAYASHVPQEILSPIVRVQYDSRNWESAYRDITTALANCHLFLDEIEYGVYTDDELNGTQTLAIQPGGSIRTTAEIVTSVLSSKPPQVRDDVVSLIQSPDAPRIVVANFVKELSKTAKAMYAAAESTPTQLVSAP